MFKGNKLTILLLIIMVIIFGFFFWKMFLGLILFVTILFLGYKVISNRKKR